MEKTDDSSDEDRSATRAMANRSLLGSFIIHSTAKLSYTNQLIPEYVNHPTGQIITHLRSNTLYRKIVV